MTPAMTATDARCVFRFATRGIVMRARFAMVLFATGFATLTAACGERDVGPTGVSPTEPFGRARFVNAVANATTADRVNVAVDGVPMGVNLGYGTITGVSVATPYNAVYGGSRRFVVTRTADPAVTVLDAQVAITADTSQTVYATLEGTAASTFVTLDNLELPTGSQVKLRAVHLAPSMGNADVYVTAPNADLTTLTPQFTNVAPRSATDYLTLARATYQVRFTTAGTKTVRVSATVTPPTGTAPLIRTAVALDPQTGTALTSAVLSDR
jgi:uncharacterized protein DUF4397